MVKFGFFALENRKPHFFALRPRHSLVLPYQPVKQKRGTLGIHIFTQNLAPKTPRKRLCMQKCPIGKIVVAKILKEKDKIMYKFGFKTHFWLCFSGGYFCMQKRFAGVQNDVDFVVLFGYVDFEAAFTVRE
jgi:hypothetical protein